MEDDIDNIYMNVGAIEPRSVANGPGERFVIWLQGCPLRCPGCINQEFLPFIEKKKISVSEMIDMILSTQGIEGVTYTGGEPIAQSKSLTYLSQHLRKFGLSIVCYSGYTLEQLKQKQDFWTNKLLSLVDILIDGPYIQEESGLFLWRGSRNQCIHFMTDRYKHLGGILDQSTAKVEFIVNNEGYTATGTLPKELLERLNKLLKG